MTLARRIAVDILCRSQSERRFASDILEDLAADLSPIDRRFTMQLIMGSIRSRRTLDTLLNPFLSKPIETMHPETLEILRVGFFQIAFLTQIPRHASVHETVNLAPPMVRKFVNAMMRKGSDLVSDDMVMSPASNALPVFVHTGQSYRRLNQPIFANPDVDFPGYFPDAFSLPDWMTERWIQRYSREDCFLLGFTVNTPAPLWIRVNALLGTREQYCLNLNQSHIAFELGEHPQSLKIQDSVAIRDLPGYREGAFSVQDHSSMLVASALAPQPGWKVLDLCSAPGGKTTHLAELMSNQGRITACDIIPERLNTVEELSRRLKVNIIHTRVIRNDDVPPGPFDAVLVDVPCSNTGVLARRPEVRWRLQPQEFQHLVPLQERLLRTAVERVRRGGVIVYSTCSIEPEENVGVVSAVVRQFPGLKLDVEQSSIPGQPADGGYWARLVKT